MPLVVPGMMNTESESSAQGTRDEWMFKLAGKKISDSTNDVNSFAKKDLPKRHRIIGPGDAVTQDYHTDRLNVHVGEDGVVHDVNFG